VEQEHVKKSEVDMSNESVEDREALVQRVKASLQKAEGAVSSLRTTSTRLIVAGVVSSAAATLVAGITAANGPVVGDGIEGWRAACLVAALFAFVSTISTGVNQQLKFNDRLAEGTQCVGQLRSLELAVATGSRNWAETVQEYEEIAKSYPEFIN
jgi:hypothetical protein